MVYKEEGDNVGFKAGSTFEIMSISSTTLFVKVPFGTIVSKYLTTYTKELTVKSQIITVFKSDSNFSWL